MRWLYSCAGSALLLVACSNGGDPAARDASGDESDALAEAGAESATDAPTDESTDGGTAPAADCGTAPAAATVTGNIGGMAVTAAEAIGVYGKDSITGVSYAGVPISNQKGTCALVQGGMSSRQGSSILMIEVARTSGSDPVWAGTYPLAAANGASANGFAIFGHFASVSAGCSQVLEDAIGGVITLDTVCGTDVVGSFALDLSMGGDAGIDHLTGTFSAPVCNFDMNNFDPNALPSACPMPADI